MRRAIKFHLFHRRRCIVRDMPPTRNLTIIFLHFRLETHASVELDVVFCSRRQHMCEVVATALCRRAGGNALSASTPAFA